MAKKRKSKLNAEKEEKYKKYLTSYKTVKTSLKSIVRSRSTLLAINNVVYKMNQIVIHTYHFLKLYCIDRFNETGRLPKIDKLFVALIMKTLAKSKGNGRKFTKETLFTKRKLELFHDEHYKPLMLEKRDLSYTNLGNMISYEAISIVTCLSNHIQEHFDELLNRYINILMEKDKLCEKAIGKDAKYRVRADLRRIKKDILYNENKSDKAHHKIISKIRKTLLKGVVINKSLAYMAKSKPLDLLIVSMRMSISGEKLAEKNRDLDDDSQFNIINCFPLRKSVIPKYVDIDTSIIIDNLLSENVGYYNNRKLESSDELWNMFFKTGSTVFSKKGYTFNRRISTDGVGCSILFVRDDLYNPFAKTSVRVLKKPTTYSEDVYVDDLTQIEKDYCLTKQLVGIDPGKNDLIYCSNGVVEKVTKGNGKIFRRAEHLKYSHKLRKEITKSDVYKRKLEKHKMDKAVIIRDRYSNGKKIMNVKDLETGLSKLNSSSCIWKNAKQYIKEKNITNHRLIDYYKLYMHRQLKWYGFMNKQKADADIVNRFKNKFGSPEETVILIGDFEQRKQMKYKEPTKGKSIRKLFRNNGYKVYLVDEFRTSCRLYGSGEELINVRGCHFLLGSKILKEKMNRDNPGAFMKDMINQGFIPTIINRDLNASLNIREKGWCILHNINEPKYMDRKICMQEVAKKRMKENSLN